MNAAIIAVGSEMLTPTRVDTNSLFLTEKLNLLGVEVVQKMVVGDQKRHLEAAIRNAGEFAQLVILTGGLGPTEDDLTREAVSAATGRALTYDRGLAEALEARFASMGRKMAEINRKQAYLLQGAEVMANPRGTAPGQWLRLPDQQIMVLLPGPPGEMKPMAEAEFFPRLERMLPPLALSTLTFRLTGMGESDLDELIAPVYKQYENPVTTILAKAGDLTVHLRAQAKTKPEAEALTAELGSKIEGLLGEKIYSHDGAPLEAVVIEKLVERGETLAVAESLTAGMLASRLGGVAGASRAFVGGVIAYRGRQKEALLGVEAQAIAEHTEVSEEVARQMAAGARQRTDASWALSLTGYAGPDGGTDANPVGTVFIGLAGPSGRVNVNRFRYPAGDRDRIRAFAAQSALNLLRLALIKGEN
jgi:nicotinamide-nucleotide amidase